MVDENSKPPSKIISAAGHAAATSSGNAIASSVAAGTGSAHARRQAASEPARGIAGEFVTPPNGIFEGVEAKTPSATPGSITLGQVATAVVRPASSSGYRLSGDSTTINVVPFEQREFQAMKARVAALELILSEIREVPTGIGHNRGPQGFEPLMESDLAEIDALVTLLKEQTPTPAIVPHEVIKEATGKASLISEKLLKYLDLALTEASKTFGQEAAKQLLRLPLWLALYGALQAVTSAATHWLQAMPH